MGFNSGFKGLIPHPKVPTETQIERTKAWSISYNLSRVYVTD